MTKRSQQIRAEHKNQQHKRKVCLSPNLIKNYFFGHPPASNLGATSELHLPRPAATGAGTAGEISRIRLCLDRMTESSPVEGRINGARVVPTRSMSVLSRSNLMQAEPSSRCGLRTIRAPKNRCNVQPAARFLAEGNHRRTARRDNLIDKNR